jgi:hypothetical protein
MLYRFIDCLDPAAMSEKHHFDLIVRLVTFLLGFSRMLMKSILCPTAHRSMKLLSSLLQAPIPL